MHIPAGPQAAAGGNHWFNAVDFHPSPVQQNTCRSAPQVSPHALAARPSMKAGLLGQDHRGHLARKLSCRRVGLTHNGRWTGRLHRRKLKL